MSHIYRLCFKSNRFMYAVLVNHISEQNPFGFITLMLSLVISTKYSCTEIHIHSKREWKIAQQNNQPNFTDQIQWFYVLTWNTAVYEK